MCLLFCVTWFVAGTIPTLSVSRQAHEFGARPPHSAPSVNSVVIIDERHLGLGQRGGEAADNGVLAWRRPPAWARCLALDRDDEFRFPASQPAIARGVAEIAQHTACRRREARPVQAPDAPIRARLILPY